MTCPATSIAGNATPIIKAQTHAPYVEGEQAVAAFEALIDRLQHEVDALRREVGAAAPAKMKPPLRQMMPRNVQVAEIKRTYGGIGQGIKRAPFTHKLGNVFAYARVIRHRQNHRAARFDQGAGLSRRISRRPSTFTAGINNRD
jgi:hypothetical protein